MYCINCGVKLADCETKCPICGTPVPVMKKEAEISKPFPAHVEGPMRMNRMGLLLVFSIVAILAILISLFIDIHSNRVITWSGYVAGAIVMIYMWVAFPLWFKKPNPIMLTGIDFGLTIPFLWLVNAISGGNWFWNFAFPISLFVSAIGVGTTALLYSIRRKHLIIIGGTWIATGCFCIFLEILINKVFSHANALLWSPYAGGILILIGIWLIVIGLCRPIREWMEKRFFI
jgi:hypothetical protein